jgi:hypothetical protein
LRHSTLTWRDTFLQAAANLRRGPQFPWVRIFVAIFFLRHATLARRVIFLPATVNLLNSQFAWILSFGFWRRSAATFRPEHRFLSPPTGITVALLGDSMLHYGLHHYSWIGLSLSPSLPGRPLCPLRLAPRILDVPPSFLGGTVFLSEHP